MFLFHLAKRNAFALCVLVFISAALLFTGCPVDDGFVDDGKLNINLIGSWHDGSWSDVGDYDGYTITGNGIAYVFGGIGYEFTSYAGTIEYISNFSKNAGVIIVKYNTDTKPTYYDGDSNPLPLKGDYLGIYYKNLNPGVSVQIGGAYIAGGAEEATLDAAITAFTAGNEGTYMGWYGTYLWAAD